MTDDARLIDELRRLSPDERETLFDLARFLSRPVSGEPDLRHVDTLTELLRRRPEVFRILRVLAVADGGMAATVKGAAWATALLVIWSFVEPFRELITRMLGR